ncbi:MAG: hypothetical protein QOF66_1835 [Mycobacterium sp.]|nr:hypothetical protein [Mycobacterium sp.]
MTTLGPLVRVRAVFMSMSRICSKTVDLPTLLAPTTTVTEPGPPSGWASPPSPMLIRSMPNVNLSASPVSASVMRTTVSVGRSSENGRSAASASVGRRPPHHVTLEMRTLAGPSSAVQCVFISGPYTTSSHVRHVQVVWPPPWPRQA